MTERRFWSPDLASCLPIMLGIWLMLLGPGCATVATNLWSDMSLLAIADDRTPAEGKLPFHCPMEIDPSQEVYVRIHPEIGLTASPDGRSVSARNPHHAARLNPILRANGITARKEFLGGLNQHFLVLRFPVDADFCRIGSEIAELNFVVSVLVPMPLQGMR